LEDVALTIQAPELLVLAVFYLVPVAIVVGIIWLVRPRRRT
jgi:hypothetical protein